jgi:hypothetical protein
VWSCEEWDFTHSLNPNTFKKLCVLSLSTKKGFHPNGAPLDSKKVFDAACYLDKTRYFLCRINSFQFLANPSRRHWTLARRVVKTTKESVVILRSELGGPVKNSPMLKAARNSEMLTFADIDFASYEDNKKNRSEACLFCNSMIFFGNQENQIASPEALQKLILLLRLRESQN